MTRAYDLAIVAAKAAELRDALDAAAKHVECHIVQHRMAEVRGECLWAEACFGGGDAFVKSNDKEKKQMIIDNETRRYILDRLTAIREAIEAKHPGKKERAVIRSVREIEELVK